MKESTSFQVISDYLPLRIRTALSCLDPAKRTDISEIRLYSGRPVALVCPDCVRFLTTNGLTASRHNTDVVIAKPDDISAAVDSVTHFSIHSCARELRQGYFVLSGGVRVGISGVYCDKGYITSVTGLNFRISRNVTGCAEVLLPLIDDGVLICGGVNSGKTTILRDLCRLVGDRRKTALIDERNELAFSRSGVVMNDVGALTDVLTGCNRSAGIIAAVRSLSPEFIFCDEISTEEDCHAILDSMGCGVRFCATIHGMSVEDLHLRPIGSRILGSGAFGHVVVLKGSERPGSVEEVRRLNHA